MEVPHITFRLEKKKSLKIDGWEYFSAYDFSLTEREIEKARAELHETEEKKVIKLKELREKLASDNDFNYRTDTPFLLRFLRVRKYDSSKAYQNIRGGYMFKKKHPYLSEIPQNLEKLLNLNVFQYLPYANRNGVLPFFFDIENWKLEDTSFQEMTQALSLIFDIITANPKLQVNGAIAVFDVKGLTLQKSASILSNFGPKEYSFYMQNMYPWRVKNVFIVNTSQITRLFYRLVRPFLSKKLSERIYLLGSDMKELHQYVDPVLLPKKLGGFLDENQYCLTQNIMDNVSYLKYNNSFTSTGNLA